MPVLQLVTVVKIMYAKSSFLYFYHGMTRDSFTAFTVTVTPQSVLWKYTFVSVYNVDVHASMNTYSNSS